MFSLLLTFNPFCKEGEEIFLKLEILKSFEKKFTNQGKFLANKQVTLN